jgi:hypothetical protein
MADVRLVEGDPEIRAGQDYYVFTTFEIEVVAHSLSSHSEAASVRNGLLSSTIDALRDNARTISSLIETSRIGPIAFAGASDDEKGEFVAAATFQLITESYVDA